MTDVLVVGGGVAGASLALLLGRAGLRVTIFEQHHFPREKACAEGLMPAGVGVLARLGLAEAVGGARFFGVCYHAFGTHIETTFPAAAFGLGQRRSRLDTLLFAAARDTPGVTTHEGVRVDGPLVDDGRVVGLVVDGTSVRAPLVVAADGPRSVVRRKLGLDGRLRAQPRLGLRAHFRLPDGVRVPSLVEVFVGDGHELYLTPLPENEVALAVLTTRGDFAGDSRAAFARLIVHHPTLAARLDGAEQTSALAGQLPLESRARHGVRPGLALLGDAAGFLDPITGAGMAQALLSAELLAAHVTRPQLGGTVGFDPSYETLLGFDRARRARLRDSVVLTRVVLALARRPRLARGALRVLSRAPVVYRHLVAVAGGTRPLLPG